MFELPIFYSLLSSGMLFLPNREMSTGDNYSLDDDLVRQRCQHYLGFVRNTHDPAPPRRTNSDMAWMEPSTDLSDALQVILMPTPAENCSSKAITSASHPTLLMPQRWQLYKIYAHSEVRKGHQRWMGRRWTAQQPLGQETSEWKSWAK